MQGIKQLLGGVTLALYSLALFGWATSLDPVVKAMFLNRFAMPAHFLLAIWLGLTLLNRRLRYQPVHLMSHIEGHAGLCSPVWVNKNRISRRMTGSTTGFFKLARRIGDSNFVWLSGPEFHGEVHGSKVCKATNLGI